MEPVGWCLNHTLCCKWLHVDWNSRKALRRDLWRVCLDSSACRPLEKLQDDHKEQEVLMFWWGKINFMFYQTEVETCVWCMITFLWKRGWPVGEIPPFFVSPTRTFMTFFSCFSSFHCFMKLLGCFIHWPFGHWCRCFAFSFLNIDSPPPHVSL